MNIIGEFLIGVIIGLVLWFSGTKITVENQWFKLTIGSMFEERK